MLALRVTVPIACFRKGFAGQIRDGLGESRIVNPNRGGGIDIRQHRRQGFRDDEGDRDEADPRADHVGDVHVEQAVGHFPQEE